MEHQPQELVVAEDPNIVQFHQEPLEVRAVEELEEVQVQL